jgi:hypothetical protein
MDIWDFGLGAVALGCTVIMAIIPLRHNIYDKSSERYTKPGKWFICLAIVAFVSGVTLQARTYIESVESENKYNNNQLELHLQINDLQRHLDSVINSGKRHLDGPVKARLVERINDSLRSHGLPPTTEITLGYTLGNEEAGNFALEVARYLGSIGYNVNRGIGPTVGNEGKGFWLNISEGKLFVDVGVASHNGYP